MDIKQLIGETTDYNKKLALEEKKPKSWCKSISAFANCFGGKLIFGLSNNSELVGLADAGQLIAFMRIENESVPATPSQLRELVLRGSGESYYSLKSRYDFGNMLFTKLKSVYKQRTGITFEETDYESLGLIDENVI